MSYTEEGVADESEESDSDDPDFEDVIDSDWELNDEDDEVLFESNVDGGSKNVNEYNDMGFACDISDGEGEDSKRFDSGTDSTSSEDEEERIQKGERKKKKRWSKWKQFTKNDLKNPVFELGMEFPNADAFRDAVRVFSVKTRKAIRFITNDSKRVHSTLEDLEGLNSQETKNQMSNVYHLLEPLSHLLELRSYPRAYYQGITCGRCHKKGHNSRTCARREAQSQTRIESPPSQNYGNDVHVDQASHDDNVQPNTTTSMQQDQAHTHISFENTLIEEVHIQTPSSVGATSSQPLFTNPSMSQVYPHPQSSSQPSVIGSSSEKGRLMQTKSPAKKQIHMRIQRNKAPAPNERSQRKPNWKP